MAAVPYIKLMARAWARMLAVLALAYILGFLLSLAITTSLVQRRGAEQIAEHIRTTLTPLLQIGDEFAIRQFLATLTQRQHILGIQLRMPDGQRILSLQDGIAGDALIRQSTSAAAALLQSFSPQWVFHTSFEVFVDQPIQLSILHRNDEVAGMLLTALASAVGFVLLTLVWMAWRSRRFIVDLTRPVQALAQYVSQQNHRQPPPDAIMSVAETRNAYLKFAADAAELEKQLALKGKFEGMSQMAQMAAHDLRRPFAALKLALSQSAMSQSAEDLRQTIALMGQEASSAIRAAEGLFDDMLELGAVCALQTERVSLLASVSDVVDSIQPALSLRGVQLRVAVDDAAFVRAEPSRLRRVLENLIENAVSAAPPMADVWIEARPSEVGCVQITVGNSGSYIEESDRQRVFEAFFTKGKPQGTGLGLAICQKIVTDHGARIWCDSDRERGTEFHLLWPIDTTQLGVIQPLAAGGSRPTARTADRKRVRVAYIDDNVFLCSIWAKGAPGLLVQSFTSPEDFWGHWRESSPSYDVVVTDYAFSAATGADFARQLRVVYAGPILVSTEMKPGAFDASVFDGVLPKGPPDYDALAGECEHGK